MRGLLAQLHCRLYGHDWRFYDPQDGIEFTGYLERCSRCGEIVQVPQ